MKITIYELLGLIKEGKAPNKIKYGNKIYFRGWSDYMGDEPIDEYYYDSEQNSWNDELCLKLDDSVEIIEEEKEIEISKMIINEEFLFSNSHSGNMRREDRRLLDSNFKEISNKINQIIDVINDMRDKE